MVSKLHGAIGGLGLFALAGGASGAVQIFTAESSWNSAAVSGGESLFVETFDTYEGYYDAPLWGNSGGVDWFVQAPGGLFASAGLFSTNSPSAGNQAMVFNFDDGLVRGVGGNIFATDFDFNFVTSIMRIRLNDGTEYSQLVTNAAGFIGFYTDTGWITSVAISAQAVVSTPNLYPTIDDLSFSYVPAPGALALLGLAGLALGRRRR